MKLLLAAFVAAMLVQQSHAKIPSTSASKSSSSSSRQRVRDDREKVGSTAAAVPIVGAIDVAAVKSVITPSWGALFAVSAAANVLTLKARGWYGSAWAVSASQLLLGSVFVFASKIKALPRLSKDEAVKLLPSAVLLALGSGWLTHALFLGGGFTNTLKTLQPLLAVLLGYAFDRALPGRLPAAALVAIFLGVIYSVNGNVDVGGIQSLFQSQHAKYALGSMAALALRARLASYGGGSGVADDKLDAYTALLAAALLVPVALHYEGRAVFRGVLDTSLNNPEALAFLASSAVALALVGDAAVKVAGGGAEAGAVGHGLNRVVTLAAIHLVSKEAFSQDRVLGLAVAVLGGVVFEAYST